ncbi:MAG: hypothetical protein J5497_07680 [Selenomonadaceae bacterium]|nr:hypothetical protein [Selenomonadaceae bacterium]
MFSKLKKFFNAVAECIKNPGNGLVILCFISWCCQDLDRQIFNGIAISAAMLYHIWNYDEIKRLQDELRKRDKYRRPPLDQKAYDNLIKRNGCCEQEKISC